MATEDITVTEYIGSLVGTDLFGGQTILLNGFGSSQTGTLEDDDGFLGDMDDGTATFNGDPINYIGSGTVQAGVDAGLIIVPLGPEYDVVVFEAGGNTYFHYPDGEPSLLGAVALIVDIDATPYEVFTPICFGPDTMILTPNGYCPVGEIKSGDWVRDADGQAHEVLWASSRKVEIPSHPAFDKWRPIRIARNSFGDGVPYRDTYLSPQHRVELRGAATEMVVGTESCLVAAKGLVNDKGVRVDREARSITYHHLVCEAHVALVANGMHAESLYLNPETPEFRLDAGSQEAASLFPELTMKLNAPVATRREAAVLASYL
ncbi:Hint domain-containing protein [Vannielia sp. SX4]|uniref:Hint domain-containing protein n=1 Tax=Vannielia sp. SX4 TaxID=3463852 RepID=UPI00405813A8